MQPSNDYVKTSISTPDLHGLTTPTLFDALPETDGLNELVNRYLNADYREYRHAPIDLTGAYHDQSISDLINKRNWRAVARWAKDHIIDFDLQDERKLFKLWFLRLYSLCKLRLYAIVTREANRLDEACLTSGISIDTLPFELKVLIARIPALNGKILETIDKLYALLRECKGNKNSLSQNRQDSLTLMIIRYFYDLGDYVCAIRLMKAMALRNPESPETWYALGKLYLVCGDINQGYEAIEQAHKQGENNVDIDTLSDDPSFALMYVASGQWDLAQTLFQQQAQDQRLSDRERIISGNNSAALYLYQGQVAEAIDAFEDLLLIHPSKVAAADPVLFNLATLYELQSDASLAKKVRLLESVSPHTGDGFAAGCLKLPL